MLKVLFSAAAATALLSGHALAGDFVTQSVRLHVDRVNYDNPAQVQALYVHIETVARQTCIDQPDPALPHVAPDLNCVNHLVADAVGKINRPQLTAIYENLTPARSPRSVLAGNDQ
jgi:UrcA family protein